MAPGRRPIRPNAQPASGQLAGQAVPERDRKPAPARYGCGADIDDLHEASVGAGDSSGRMATRAHAVPAETIIRTILVLRGQKVMLDTDLAALYGVETRALLQAVRRNRARFPADFMFQLTWEEARSLRSQSVILATTHAAMPARRGGVRRRLAVTSATDPTCSPNKVSRCCPVSCAALAPSK